MAVTSGAGEIPVPNGSFESPGTDFVSLTIDSWQKTPKPPGYIEGGGFTWDQLTGLFKNPAPGLRDHIVNCHGAQALWVFAVPGAGLFQSSFPGGAGGTGGGAVRFEVGKGYRLIVGVIGGGYGMAPGTSLELGLHFLDAASTQVTVSSTRVVHDPAVFTSMTNLVDFSVAVPPVQAGDPWAGQTIGVHLVAGQTPAGSGGYWDLDHVRLRELVPTSLGLPTVVDGQIEFLINSEPGLKFVVQATDTLTPPAVAWMPLGTVTNDTGAIAFRELLVPAGRRYYRAEQIP